MAQFEIKNLSFRYPVSKRLILSDVSFDIERGEYLVLLGKSGSGKTTLLRHLKPVLTPKGERGGEILFNGKDISALDLKTEAESVGYVMQNPDSQIVTDKVWHELSFGLESIGLPQNAIRTRVAEMASFFGIQDWFERDVSELSGGQKQLLNLASIMVMRPEVLILDEPTSQLDPIAATDFLNTVRKINLELGTTVIITEHRLEEILPAADRAVFMEDGKVLSIDHPKKIGEMLYESGSDMFLAMPCATKVFYGTKGKGDAPVTVREGRAYLDRLFSGKEVTVKGIEETADSEKKETVLSLKDVWFRYEKDSRDILKGVSLDLERGELFALVGGNGTGKSTLLKAVGRIVKPYRGKITVLGKDITKYKGGELYHECLSILPQDPVSVFVKNTVLEELAEMTDERSEVDRIAALCEIEGLLSSHPLDISGGEQERVALAKVLLTKPEILMLDEPTKGLDNVFKMKFAEILKELMKKGVTVIMVSHDIEFCAKYADRVGMFFNGEMVTADTPRNFFKESSFYTTSANRMSRHIFTNAVTDEDVTELCRMNLEK